MYTVQTIIGANNFGSMIFYERFHTAPEAAAHFDKIHDEGNQNDCPIIGVYLYDPKGEQTQAVEWDPRTY